MWLQAQAHIPQNSEEMGLQVRLPDIAGEIDIQMISKGQRAAILGGRCLGTQDEIETLHKGQHFFRQTNLS